MVWGDQSGKVGRLAFVALLGNQRVVGTVSSKGLSCDRVTSFTLHQKAWLRSYGGGRLSSVVSEQRQASEHHVLLRDARNCRHDLLIGRELARVLFGDAERGECDHADERTDPHQGQHFYPPAVLAKNKLAVPHQIAVPSVLLEVSSSRIGSGTIRTIFTLVKRVSGVIAPTATGTLLSNTA